MKSKYKYLFANMGWLSISNFGSKVLVFLLVPFYTRVLTPEEYGVYDIFYTAVILLSPIVTSNIAEALMRFALLEEDNHKLAFTNALVVSVVGSAVVGAIAFIVVASGVLAGDMATYLMLSWGMLVADIMYQLAAKFARGIDRVAAMAIGGLVQALMLFGLSLLFILVFGWGLVGYFWATLAAFASGAVFIAWRCGLWRYFDVRLLSGAYTKKMVSYGLPLGVNTLGWWANSTLGRWAVAAFGGFADTGLLSAAFKIPTVPKTIQSVFVQAWQISSIKEFDESDKDGFFSNTYNGLCFFSSLLTSLVLLVLPWLAMLLFGGDFYEAWHFVPLLMIGVVFNGLSSTLGGIFMAVGDSKHIALSAGVSVVVNLVLCVLLVPVLGVQGAAIASVASSATIWLMRLLGVRKYISLQVSWGTTALCFVVIVLQSAIAIMCNDYTLYLALEAPCFVFLSVATYKKLGMKALVQTLLGKLKRR